ncbi:conjugative transposon protein TraM [Myroides albus]|uniref:Conjugative transposon protein TraM n=1 Tax=Myroides albus TaxID=2562892 RepID=A0A6I3LPI5_9FLAO|nr:conjugative transposon protein TraM [Myroides albus]MTG99336.1 conjugative transposon protein TraM [Myroides albus]UVD79092.1 conjugative transposon protein TraM [Myroides albus]
MQSNNQSSKGFVLEKYKNGIFNKYKKYFVYLGLFGIFSVVMYFLFLYETSNKSDINPIIPEVTNIELPSDKLKAYEQEFLKARNTSNSHSNQTLLDYYIEKDSVQQVSDYPNLEWSSKRRSLENYQLANQAVSEFYKPEKDKDDYNKLFKELDQLKSELKQGVDNRQVRKQEHLELMQKSFEMASRYIPGSQPEVKSDLLGFKQSPNKNIAAVESDFKSLNVVSSLKLSSTLKGDSTFNSKQKVNGFNTAYTTTESLGFKNSIKASILEHQTIVNNGWVKLLLLEDILIQGAPLGKQSVIVARVTLNSGRAEFVVESIKLDQSIVEVELIGYDRFGQRGLEVLNSQEIDASKEILANAGQSTATSISMTKSVADQIAGDLTKGIIQGVSGYFSKKVKTQRVTFKKGQEVFLLPKQ